MDADGDMKNAYNSARARRERFLDDVEDEASRWNQMTDDERFDSDDRAVYARLRAAFPEERDRRVIHLMLENVRDTESYASALEIAYLPPDEQAAEVKRVKDRIKKRMRRLMAADE
jgi:hypothetical protein